MNFEKIMSVFEKNGFSVKSFETKEEAVAYLNSQIDQKTVGFGGSCTLLEMGLNESLSKHNTVYDHWKLPKDMTAAQVRNLAGTAKVYICSANAISETGEIVNIDGTGNRLASMIYGHEKNYFVVGKNKIAKNFFAAIQRAKNIAAPLNAKRLNRKTPCVATGKCENCSSPERICRATTVLTHPTTGSNMEIIFVNEDLGY